MESEIDNCIIPIENCNDNDNKSHLATNEIIDITKAYNMDAELSNSKSTFKSNTENTSAFTLNIKKMNSEQENADSDAKDLHRQQTGESLLQSSQNLLQSNSNTIAVSKLYPNQMNIIPFNWKNGNVSNSIGNLVLESPYSDNSCDTDQIDRACLQINRLENALNEDCKMQDDEDLQMIRTELHNQLKNHQCSNDIINEVTLAINRFELSLKAGKFTNTNQEKRKLVLSLINTLQASLKSSTKATPKTATSLLSDLPDNAAAKANSHQRFGKCRSRSHRHTIGVSYKELADARECIEKMQTASNSPPYEENISDINNIDKFLNYDLPKDDLGTACPQMNPFNTQKHLLNNNANHNFPKIASSTDDPINQRYFMKRANTVDIAKMKNSIKSNNQLNNVSSNGRYSDTKFKSVISGNEKKSKEEKKSIIPPLIPKTLNDLKFLAFINKQNDKANMGWSGTRTNSNWTDKFYYIKKSFESAGNSPNTVKAQISIKPLQTNTPSYQLESFNQNKYERKTGSLTELKQISEPKSKLKFNQNLTLKSSVPSIINQFKHAAHSVFKPMPYLKATGRLLGTLNSSKENNKANKSTSLDNQNPPSVSNATIHINYKNNRNNNNNNNDGNDTVNDGKTYLKRNMSLYQPNTNRSESEAYRRRFSVSENSTSTYNPTYRNSELTTLEALPPPININFCYARQSADPNRATPPENCFSSPPALKTDYKRLANLVEKQQQQLDNTCNQSKQIISPTNTQPLILTYANPKFNCQDYNYNSLLTNYNHIIDNETTTTYNNRGEKNNLPEFCAISRIMEKPKSHKATTTLKQLSHIHDFNDKLNSKKLKKNLLDIRSNNVRQNNFHSSLSSIQMPPNENTYTSYSVVHSTPNNLNQLNANKCYDDRTMYEISTATQQTSDGSIDFNDTRRNEAVNNSLNTSYYTRMNPDFLPNMQSVKPKNCTSHYNQMYSGYQNTLLVQNNQLNKVAPSTDITESRRSNNTKFMNGGMKFHKQSENISKQMPVYEMNKKNPKYQRQGQTIYINSENDEKSIITSDAPDVVKSSLQLYDRINENSYHKPRTFDSRLASKTKQNSMANMQYPSHPLPANSIVYNNIHDIEDVEGLRQHNNGNIRNPENVHPTSYDNALRRTKSGINTYMVAKKYEAGISKEDIDEKQRTVAAYFSGQPLLAHKSSQQTPINYSPLIYNAASHQTSNNRVMESDDKQIISKTSSIKNLPMSQKPNHEISEDTKSLAPLTNTRAPSFPKQTVYKCGGNALNSRAATAKEQLLNWCRSKTEEYPNIEIKNFSSSWSDGLAFCALIHHFLPDAFDYNELTGENRRKNFELAFAIAEEKADIAPLLDVDDMVNMKRPDWKCVFVYVQSIHQRFRNFQ